MPPCPKCWGPSRETTHMICLECGTDYLASPPQKLTENGLRVLCAGLEELARLREENAALRRTLADARPDYQNEPEGADR